MTTESGAKRSPNAGGVPHVSNSGWQLVPINECGQSLQQLLPEDRLFVQPIYRRLGYDNALDRICLRVGVIERQARTRPHDMSCPLFPERSREQNDPLA